MVLKHLRDTTREPLARLDMQEFIRPMRIRLRSQQSCNKELRFRETLTEHAHERNRTAGAHVHRRFAEERI